MPRIEINSLNKKKCLTKTNLKEIPCVSLRPRISKTQNSHKYFLQCLKCISDLQSVLDHLCVVQGNQANPLQIKRALKVYGAQFLSPLFQIRNPRFLGGWFGWFGISGQFAHSISGFLIAYVGKIWCMKRTQTRHKRRIHAHWAIRRATLNSLKLAKELFERTGRGVTTDWKLTQANFILHLWNSLVWVFAKCRWLLLYNALGRVFPGESAR